MNPIIESLRTDRATIYAAAETLQLEIDSRQRRIDMLRSEADGLTRAIVKLEDAEKATPEDALPVKVPRLNTEKAVLDALSDGPHTMDELVAVVGRPDRQITPAITRLGAKVEFGGSYGGDQHRCYRLAGSAEQVAA